MLRAAGKGTLIGGWIGGFVATILMSFGFLESTMDNAAYGAVLILLISSGFLYVGGEE